MKHRNLTIPEIAQIAGTRIILGVGIGLLLADKLHRERRRDIGWTLLAVGALSTIPIVANVLNKPSLDGRVGEFAEVSG